jgi:hypothetical protein
VAVRSFKNLGVGSVLLAVIGGCFDLGGQCANDPLADLPSPDGRWHAVMFQRDCGATTGFSTQVSVLLAGNTLQNESGNAFIADTDHGAAPAGPGGGPLVLARWIAPDTLEVRFHPRSRVFTRQAQVGAVAMRYVANSTAVP